MLLRSKREQPDTKKEWEGARERKERWSMSIKRGNRQALFFPTHSQSRREMNYFCFVAFKGEGDKKRAVLPLILTHSFRNRDLPFISFVNK